MIKGLIILGSTFITLLSCGDIVKEKTIEVCAFGMTGLLGKLSLYIVPCILILILILRKESDGSDRTLSSAKNILVYIPLLLYVLVLNGINGIGAGPADINNNIIKSDWIQIKKLETIKEMGESILQKITSLEHRELLQNVDISKLSNKTEIIEKYLQSISGGSIEKVSASISVGNYIMVIVGVVIIIASVYYFLRRPAVEETIRNLGETVKKILDNEIAQAKINTAIWEAQKELAIMIQNTASAGTNPKILHQIVEEGQKTLANLDILSQAHGAALSRLADLSKEVAQTKTVLTEFIEIVSGSK